MSIMSRSVYSSLWKVSPPLERCDMTLKTYSGKQLPVIGKTYVLARYKGQSEQLPLLIVENSGPTLLGRDWLQHLRLDWSEVNLLATSSRQLVGILQEHSKLFQQGLGTFTGAPVDIQLLPDVPHNFFKARSVPFVLKDQIEMELDRLMSEGVITHIKSSSWAAPIVPVMKRDGKIRICGDYKLTANIASKLDVYPLPKIEELFHALAGGKMFTKLDLSHAYLQLPIAGPSKPLTTINTHKGLFQYNRLPFGIASAPVVFQ